MANPTTEKFTGTTLEAAIESINQKWGPDAAILHVERKSTRGGILSAAKTWVEVTARAPEPKQPSADTLLPASLPSSATPLPFPASFANEIYSIKKEAKEEVPPVVEAAPTNRLSSVLNEVTATISAAGEVDPLAEYLIDRGMNSEDVYELIADWKKKNPTNDLSYCIADLDRRIPRLGWKEIFPAGKSRCTLLLGLPGAGKTSLLVKMAARLKLESKAEVLILSGDVSRAGPSQELALYSEILQVPVTQIFDLGEIKNAIQDVTSNTHILVDWCGISPYDPASFRQLENFRGVHPNAQILVTASLASDLRMWKRIGPQFTNLPLVGLALTQADLEFRIGKIWEGVRGTNLPLAFVSTGKNVPGDISEGTGFPFGRILMKDYQAREAFTSRKDLVA